MRNQEGGTILADVPEGEPFVQSRESGKGLMIESVSIKNFRCFKEAKAENLGRINVIVGDNGSGKTAFLEALYLTSGDSPENHAKLFGWRETGQFAGVVLSTEEIMDGSFWQDLFHGFSFENDVAVHFQGEQNRALTIRHRGKRSGKITSGRDAMSSIEFKWLENGKAVGTAVPKLVGGKLEWSPVKAGVKTTMVPLVINQPELTRRFSELRQSKKEGPFTKAILESFRDIKELSLEITTGDKAALFASLGSIPDKLVPVPLVSSGIYRLFNMMLAVAYFPGGAVFIDEIETGIYYDRLSDLWNILDHVSAADEPTQVFASTHSAEALDALVPIAAKKPDDFRLIRLSGGEIEVFDGADFSAARAGKMEVR